MFRYLYYKLNYPGVDAEILKRGDPLCRPPWLAGEKSFRFQMVLIGRNNVRNYKFLAKYFYQYFQIFSIFIDKILSIFQNLLTRW